MSCYTNHLRYGLKIHTIYKKKKELFQSMVPPLNKIYFGRKHECIVRIIKISPLLTCLSLFFKALFSFSSALLASILYYFLHLISSPLQAQRIQLQQTAAFFFSCFLLTRMLFMMCEIHSLLLL